MAWILWLWPAGAQAAFPGRNGLLAVQPRQGREIELVTSAGRVVRRICGPASRCGQPVGPRWSPDGRELVFDGPAVRIVYADGSCLNCTFGDARNPSFEPGGTLISFAGRPQLRVDGIDGVHKLAPAVRGATDAVWSAGGELAIVRGGEIWAGAPDRQRRLGAGAEPSWAPDGRTLAAADGGWVVVYPDGRRLARGTAPAFSPDGRLIAYVGPGGRLMVIGEHGGRPRRVGSVRAAAVDWQPVPEHPTAGCIAPPGSTVLARSPQAVVTGDNLGLSRSLDFADADGPAYMGCLRADGRERLLEHFTDENVDQVHSASDVVTAGSYAALIDNFVDEHYDQQSSTVQVFDLRTGALRPPLGGQSTDYTLDHLVLGADGATAVHVDHVFPEGSLSRALYGMACVPGGTLCAIPDDSWRVFSSNDPTGGRASWAMSMPGGPPSRTGPPVPQGAESVACPATTLCVAVGFRTAYTSANLASATPTWQATTLPDGASLDQVVCPSSALCVGVGSGAEIVVSTDPAGGRWSAYTIDPGGALDSVLCPSASECLVSDNRGDAFASTDPAGGALAWHASISTPAFSTGSCAGPSFCVVAGSELYESTDPMNGPWRSIARNLATDAISCPSASLCLAIGVDGIYVSAHSATGGWTRTTTTPGTSIDCPSTTLCVAADAHGSVFTSTDPAGGASAWTRTPVDISPCTANSDCSFEQLLASSGHGVQTLDSSQIPGDGPFLTGFTLTGDTLTWSHDGTPRSATLTR